MNTFKGRDFLKLLDFTPAEIGALLDLSADLKAKKKNGVVHRLCEGKNLALIFEKTSTRTRCAFEVAARDLGMGVTYLDPTGSQIGTKESIADTARVLSGMFDGIEYRGFGQSIVEELAKYASVPVFNGLTDEFHPTQILADFLTVREHFGSWTVSIIANMWNYVPLKKKSSLRLICVVNTTYLMNPNPITTNIRLKLGFLHPGRRKLTKLILQ